MTAKNYIVLCGTDDPFGIGAFGPFSSREVAQSFISGPEHHDLDDPEPHVYCAFLVAPEYHDILLLTPGVGA